MESLLRRHPENPILTPKELPFDAYTVFNAGAVRFHGDYLLLLRTETRAKEISFNMRLRLSQTIIEELVDFCLKKSI